jgi:hypothetical protein
MRQMRKTILVQLQNKHYKCPISEAILSFFSTNALLASHPLKDL